MAYLYGIENLATHVLDFFNEGYRLKNLDTYFIFNIVVYTFYAQNGKKTHFWATVHLESVGNV